MRKIATATCASVAVTGNDFHPTPWTPSCADRIKPRPTRGPVPRLSLSPEVASAHDDISARFVAHHDDDGLALAGGAVAGAGLSVSRGQDDRAIWRRRSDRYLHARSRRGAAQ